MEGLLQAGSSYFYYKYISGFWMLDSACGGLRQF
ncbi:hypothetical protein V6Z12_A01G193800 [Gossypium hirsutum]